MTPRISPEKALGDIIYKVRKALDLTQDQYGVRHNVTGPAVFKFEKAFMRPSLPLWLAMALEPRHQLLGHLLWHLH